MNLLLVGMLSHSFLLVTNDYYVFDLSPLSVRGDENSTQMFLGNPVPIEEKWPALVADKNFIKIRKMGIYNAFTVRDDESEYILWITWIKLHNSTPGVTYDVKNDKILEKGFRFKNDKKQVMISSSEKMLFYGLRDQSGSGKPGLHISEFTFDAKVLSKAETMNRNGPWMALCSEPGGKKMHIIKDSSSGKSCHPVEWKNVIKGFIDSDQVFLFGSQYIYLFDLKALTSPGTVSKITKKRYDKFFVCHMDYTLVAFIIIILLFLLLLLLTIIWLCCCRNRRKKKNDTNETSNKSKKSKKGKPKSGMGRAAHPKNNAGARPMATEQMSRRSKKSVKKPVAPSTQGGYKSTGPNALTRRSKGGTKKSMKKSKSNKPTSKYNSYAHDGTGRSVFKQKQ